MPLDIAMQNAQLKKRQLMSTILIIFCVLGAVTIATAFLTIFSRKSTVPYILSFVFHNKGHYLCWTLNFAIVHIIVYSGAIMILFFTIMLMNLNKENEVHKPRITRLGAIVSFFLLDN
jgi:NADH-quinone oxidoreductase subunit J